MRYIVFCVVFGLSIWLSLATMKYGWGIEVLNLWWIIGGCVGQGVLMGVLQIVSSE